MASSNGTAPTSAPEDTAAPASSAPPSSDPPSSAPPPSSDPPSSVPPPSSTPNPPPSSSAPPPSSTPPPPSSTPPPPPPTTQKTTATPSIETIVSTALITPSVGPVSTQVITSVATSFVTPTPTPDHSQSSIDPGAQSTTGPPNLQTSSTGSGSGSGGLQGGSQVAVAVVVPVVAVALLVLGGIFLWRRRKAKQNNEDARRKEMEEYGFNPNNDPTLPAVGGSVMAEDTSGYRGWGNTTTTSRGVPSTAPFSDSGSAPGGFTPGSPPNSDGNSADPLMNDQRRTMDSETVAAIGAAPLVGGAGAAARGGVQRGPSNASSSYDGRSDNSGEGLPNFENYTDNGYYQGNGYDGTGPQPIIRDVSARRNTRIENPSVVPQQGNSGIAQNF